MIDGKPAEGVLSVFDEGLIRGDGCFEVIRSYRGVPFALDLHFERLTRSAAALELVCPDLEELGTWVKELSIGDCLVRVVLTRGSAEDLPGRCLVMTHAVPEQVAGLRLRMLTAPWHPGGESWELSGVKTISYAPNMAASRLARSGGCDDALLVSRDNYILEGPTFAVAWIRDGVIETPDLDLGILDSVTRRLLLAEAAADGLAVRTGRFPPQRLREASEVVALSTVKEVTPVISVDALTFTPGEITHRLDGLYRALTASAFIR